MKLKFQAKTNKTYCRIDSATFHLLGGGTITIDRQCSACHWIGDILYMEWSNIYIWKINDIPIFSEQNVHPNEGLHSLLEQASVEFTLDDEADEDYFVSDISWCLCV